MESSQLSSKEDVDVFSQITLDFGAKICIKTDFRFQRLKEKIQIKKRIKRKDVIEVGGSVNTQIFCGKHETNSVKSNVNIHSEDRLSTYQYQDRDMELKHPKSLYKHKQLHLPSSQVDMQLNLHICHYNMLQAKRTKPDQTFEISSIRHWRDDTS